MKRAYFLYTVISSSYVSDQTTSALCAGIHEIRNGTCEASRFALAKFLGPKKPGFIIIVWSMNAVQKVKLNGRSIL